MAVSQSEMDSDGKRKGGRPKGLPKTGGRQKGVANVATRDAREAIGRFVDGNAHRLQEWLDRIAVTDPERAFTLFQSVIEYHVPKLARQEIDATVKGSLNVIISETDSKL